MRWNQSSFTASIVPGAGRRPSTTVCDTDRVGTDNVRSWSRAASVDLRRLRYFVAVAEERHFGRAAARLHVTTPPLSQRIRELEQALGLELFERTSRHVALTPAGERLLVDAREVLRAVDRFTAAAGELAVGPDDVGGRVLPWQRGRDDAHDPGVPRPRTPRSSCGPTG